MVLVIQYSDHDSRSTVLHWMTSVQCCTAFDRTSVLPILYASLRVCLRCYLTTSSARARVCVCVCVCVCVWEASWGSSLAGHTQAAAAAAAGLLGCFSVSRSLGGDVL